MRLSGAELCALSGAKLWTPAEDAILRSSYLLAGTAVVRDLPGRSVDAVYRRVRRLGIIRKRRWTHAEDRKLALLWGEKTLAQIAEELQRPVKGIYKHAQELGLPLGCPQGYEYLTDAAKRAGFATETLRMILRWARVDVRPAMSRLGSKGMRPTHVVSPDDVDDAVEAWLKTETLKAGAVRHGISPESLERWLASSDMDVPPKPAGKKRWRIPSETIDRVVAARRGRETILAAAKRIGVPRATLRHWMVRAGVPRPVGKLWLVEREVIDQLVAKKRAA